jgi:anaerobic selenocysteine-containing dehydrogenase
VELLTELAHRLHGDRPVNWRQLQDTWYIRQLIAQTIPGYGAIGALDTTQTEFTISDRVFHTPEFPTSDRRATMFTTPLPDLTLPTWQDFGLPETTQGLILALGTGRSYSQHNTVVYKEGDYYRGMPHRNCILMNQIDGETCGLQQHQRVTVRGNAGALEQVEIIYGAIRRGSALMFYPEVNAIFSAPIDPRCGTPAYKRVAVAVYAHYS